MKILSLALCLLLALSTLAGPIKPAKGFDGKLSKSVFALYGTLGKQTHFDCTATAYEKIPGGYHLISAGHCVQEIPAGVTFSVSEDISGPLTPVTLVKVREDSEMDFSEFELKTDKQYPVISLDDESSTRIGENIVDVNFTQGYAKQISHGKIVSEPLVESEACTKEDVGCIGTVMVQMFGGPGASGSLIVSEKTHKVIGILIWGFEGTSGVGYRPISLFKKFLTMPTQAHPVPEQQEDDSIIEIILGK